MLIFDEKLPRRRMVNITIARTGNSEIHISRFFSSGAFEGSKTVIGSHGFCREADEFTRDMLISSERYRRFLQSIHRKITWSDVERLAKSADVLPCIALGRLQTDGVLDWSDFADQVIKYPWAWLSLTLSFINLIASFIMKMTIIKLTRWMNCDKIQLHHP